MSEDDDLLALERQAATDPVAFEHFAYALERACGTTERRASENRLRHLWSQLHPGAVQCCEHQRIDGVLHRCLGIVTPEVWATAAMGCGVMCEPHFLGYHHAATVAEVAARVAARREADHALRCARCGAPAHWVDGAGEALCVRHEDDY